MQKYRTNFDQLPLVGALQATRPARRNCPGMGQREGFDRDSLFLVRHFCSKNFRVVCDSVGLRLRRPDRGSLFLVRHFCSENFRVVCDSVGAENFRVVCDSVGGWARPV